LSDPWVDGIDGFLERWTPRWEGRPALLHTEIMRDHLFVDQQDGEWHISGIVDFEDAMLGAPEYDFASTGIFLSCGSPDLLRALLDAYGVKADEEFRLRVMAYALLHRYSNLKWYLERLPIPVKAGDFKTFARIWFEA